MIDLNKLHVFDVVAQTGNFSAAADRLYITQSAVSQHIKDLELALGQQFFIRERRGVRLTPSGERLAEYSRKIFGLLNQAENALTNVGELASGKLNLGATPGVGIYLTPDWVQKFRARYPQLTVVLQTGITSQIVADVLSHRLDIGIIEGEPDNLNHGNLAIQVLEEVEQLVVVGFRHPFWDRKSVNIGDLNHQSFIIRQQGSQSRTWIEEALHAHGITPIIGAEFDNLEAMKRTIAAGQCLAILPAYVVENELEQHLLRVLPIADIRLIRRLKLIWRATVSFSPLTRAFLEDLSDRYPILKSVIDQPMSDDAPRGVSQDEKL